MAPADGRDQAKRERGGDMWRVVLATDGSENAAAAGAILQALPLPPGSSIRVLCVADPFIEGLLEKVRPGEAAWSQVVVQRAAQEQQRPDVEISTEIRPGDAAGGILEAAADFEADLIVVGSKGHTGLEGILLGSVARNVATHARCAVLVARPLRNGLQQVVMATDGSENAEKAAGLAARFPLPARSRVTTASVARSEPPVLPAVALAADMFAETLEELRRESEAEARQYAEAAAALFRDAGREAEALVLAGSPAAQLLSLVEEKQADLIIAGARGASLIERLLVGSVADRLLANAPCSVLVVH
ncbi:MAG: universal stress protein [Armatimonadota bacterium]